MSAYLIFTNQHTYDQTEQDQYQSQVRDTFTGHPVTVVAASAPQVLEGTAAERVVILEFPTTDAARQWYDSPAYQAAKQHRLKGALFSVVLVEGV